MKDIKHPVAVRTIRTLLQYVPKTSSGTYNSADPTAFKKGKLVVEFEGVNYKIKYNDCTWGIEIEISKQFGPFMHQTFKEVGDIYYDYDQKDLSPRNNWVKGNLLLCAKILKHLKDTRAVNYEQLEMERYMSNEDMESGEPMDCPSGYR